MRMQPTALPNTEAPWCKTLPYPEAWDITQAVYADLTNDGAPECVLLVWRPWQDWPIAKWLQDNSPITANKDSAGYSSHIILIQPDATHGYREIWAGSALAVPILWIAAGDVDGDGNPDLVALEGNYKKGREGPAQQLAIWRWNTFGFTLEARSPGKFNTAVVIDSNDDGISEILVR